LRVKGMSRATAAAGPSVQMHNARAQSATRTGCTALQSCYRFTGYSPLVVSWTHVH